LVQSTHAPPAAPHAEDDDPPTQFAPLQQPPLHGEEFGPPHAMPHWWVAVSHALPAAQSAATLHPQREGFPGTHAWPLAAWLQSVHTAGPVAHAPATFPLSQVPFCAAEQQPPLHGCAMPHAVVHCLGAPPPGQVLPPGQSVEALQPQAPPPATAWQTWPVLAPAQSAHTPPPAPHWPLLVPATQLPFAAAEQQPPLQGEVTSHATPHRWVAALHARPAGQSPATPQPQNVIPIDETQADPLMFAVQLAHTTKPPEIAHAAPLPPGWHVPATAAEQQPPLQGWLVSHAPPHAPPTHALPPGQSAWLAQPHTPLMRQIDPTLAPVQSAQAPPDAPHEVAPIGAHSFAGLQQ
jgi:hypothetical protein